MTIYQQIGATWFCGGNEGSWAVKSLTAITGDGLQPVPRVSVSRDRPKHENASLTANTSTGLSPSWSFAGVSSHVRYVERREKTQLDSVQAHLGRPEATHAALIFIRKSAGWWQLTQDERREIFEAKSQHISGCIKFLPAIARQLFHSRDLGQPFDFITWFEFAPQFDELFESLVTFLRSTEEWNYVEREVDLRLVRTER